MFVHNVDTRESVVNARSKRPDGELIFTEKKSNWVITLVRKLIMPNICKGNQHLTVANHH